MRIQLNRLPRSLLRQSSRDGIASTSRGVFEQVLRATGQSSWESKRSLALTISVDPHVASGRFQLPAKRVLQAPVEST